MLVLSRKKNESIVINGNIRIEILQIKGKQIRLGITAPSSMKVLRSELPAASEPGDSGKRDAAKSENRDANPTPPAPPAPPAPPVAESAHVIDCNLPNIASTVVASM